LKKAGNQHICRPQWSNTLNYYIST